MGGQRAQGEIDAKLDRVASGAPLRVLDLFAGCGGISLGFHAAGFKVEAAIEIDPAASATHALNFHNGDEVHARPRDITALEPEDLVGELGLGDVSRAFDVIVGGPPCQAYARVGRAKLREIADHPEAFKIDPRGNLYLRYLHYVERTQPLAVLVENVPDALNYGGHNVMEEIADALDTLGYRAAYTLVNTAFYGVPQMRDRVFLMGIHRAVGAEISFPTPTNHLQLPVGYEGTRAVALKNIDLFGKTTYKPADRSNTQLPPAVSAHDAISDLPQITEHLRGEVRRGARRLDQAIPYPRGGALGNYATEMRTWPGFLAPTGGVSDHVIRTLPRDTAIFREMPNGGEYPAAHATAVDLWRKHVRGEELRLGRPMTEAEKQELFGKMVPPYPVGSFPNRWWKLRPDGPVRTLMAHIGKDTYSHIHYDSSQARVISVREAARLQSFPDGFRFVGTMNPAYRQIGNAVPPLMARRLAEHLMSILRASTSEVSVAAQ